MTERTDALDVGVERQIVCAHSTAPGGRVCTCPYCKTKKKVLVWRRKDIPWTELLYSTACPHVRGVVCDDTSDHWLVTFERLTKTKSR